jgi:two-component system cell cycle response regulator
MSSASRPKAQREDDTTQVLTLGPEGAVSVTPTPRDRCTLVMIHGSTPGATIPVRATRLTIGRGAQAGLQLDDSALSRLHAEITRIDGAWHVRDLGSTNGTWVDGTRVVEAVRLSDGQRLSLGTTTVFRVALQDEAEQETSWELYQSSVTDPLTRVHNRRHLDERLKSELAFAQRHQTPLSLLLLDVDYFKRINDEKGHAAGDAVLRVLGATLKKIVRTEDVVARYGGEEFAVIARGIDAPNARILGERIRKLVEGVEIPWNDGKLRLTVSIGVVTRDTGRPFEEVQKLFEAADAALYRAKHNGRNRCETA